MRIFFDAVERSVRLLEDDPRFNAGTGASLNVDGKIEPASDLETINTELILADLQTLEKAVPRLDKEVKGKKTDKSVLDAAVAAQKILESGDPISKHPGEVDLDAVEQRPRGRLPRTAEEHHRPRQQRGDRAGSGECADAGFGNRRQMVGAGGSELPCQLRPAPRLEFVGVQLSCNSDNPPDCHSFETPVDRKYSPMVPPSADTRTL